jgi:hypothetical protein
MAAQEEAPAAQEALAQEAPAQEAPASGEDENSKNVVIEAYSGHPVEVQANYC